MITVFPNGGFSLWFSNGCGILVVTEDCLPDESQTFRTFTASVHILEPTDDPDVYNDHLVDGKAVITGCSADWIAYWIGYTQRLRNFDGCWVEYFGVLA